MRALPFQRSPQRKVVRIRASSDGSKGSVNKGLDVLGWTGKLIPQSALVKGVKTGWNLAWTTLMRELAPQDSRGNYVRPSYSFAHKIGDAEFPPEPGRYVLYVGNACPWCHRVLLALEARGLFSTASSATGARLITVVHCQDDPERASRGGWYFPTPEPAFGCKDLREVYDAVNGGSFVGRCTAPLLVDTRTRRAVCNESSILMRMINDLPGNDVDLVPSSLALEVDRWNELIYDKVNNAVYRSGFATTQAAYDAAQSDLWSTLATIDSKLGESRFLLGNKVTEADLRLLPTIARFDLVYHHFFRCTRYSVRADFPNLQRWLLDLWRCPQMDVGATIDLVAAQRSYYSNLFPLNPSGIVPSGPLPEDLGLGRVVRGEEVGGAKEGAEANRSSAEDVFWRRN